MSPARSRLAALAVGAVVFAADRVSKAWVERYFAAFSLAHPEEPPSVKVVGEALRLTYAPNRGVIFGLLRTVDLAHASLIFLAGALAAIAFVVVYLLRVAPPRRALLLGLGLVLGGACGNVVDRALYGHVIDFIDVSLYFTRWYVFNVADAAIVTGVCLMALDSLRHPA